jgi:hypothetical protein
MAKKQPLYPHIPKSRQKKGRPDIYCYTPTKEFMVGLACFYANSREEADEKARAVEYYHLMFFGTWNEIGERIRREGHKEWLGEVGY